MIKKYGIGILSIVIAVAMAAFTTPKKTHFAATHVFEFTPPAMNGYSVSNVEATGNWEYLGEYPSQQLCSGSNKACRVKVTDSYVDDPSDPQQLSGVTISATLAPSGKAIVTGITDPSNNGFSNQP
ncbi:MAG: hypothetical protein ABI237_14860 [Ginsengibacter sp.]